ncbi:GNAT family N-acetyltransferase [Halogeometricum borinquense]|uniref:GNAT family N-acetyltransferase n=1 Tax=Halogeometricum borinquense TaxID=60847 RepID=A0A6C0UKR8_9EURY|nr:GNAT family N-acetyltransferase [Halogeometricum borinquense]QIB75173.1 GNAT family N-acetyltransferase [Halogeometricum borinquense]QIQ75846.1 GNAT family N-acetyltransferase [Halogeometricum borinquense]
MSTYAIIEDETGESVAVRAARPDDYDAVAAFTADTWADRGGSDYIPDIYHDWIADDDGETRQTFVVDLGAETPSDELGAIVQVVMLSPYEAWGQGIRVNPEYRGRGLAKAITEASFDFAQEAGATVLRNMIFSWNVKSLGLARDTGYDPGIEFRWAHPSPDSDASASADVPVFTDDANPDAAWSFWLDSEARTQLGGLALDPEESWALSSVTRDRLHAAADEERLLVAGAGPTRGFATRSRTYEREDDGETARWAEYAVGAWAWQDEDAAEALLAAISRDAAAVDADRTRVLIPEGVQWVSDAARAKADIAEEPTFVMEADLS